MSIEKVTKDLKDLQNSFQKARDNLCKVSLGWFNSNDESKKLQDAKLLTKRGQLTCSVLNFFINDALLTFTKEDYKEVQQALKCGSPYTTSKGKIAAVITLIFQVGNIFYQFVTIGFDALSWATISNPLVAISGGAACIIGILIYEGIKASKNSQIIQQILKLQTCVKKLEDLLIELRSR